MVRRKASASQDIITPTAVRPTAARAWKWLLRTSIDLRRIGVWGVHRHLDRYRPTTASKYTGCHVDAALRAFTSAENAFRLKRAPDDCLPRSFALAFFLRSAGLPAQHRIGVGRYPFRAHAWVQIEGRPVGEPCDVSAFVALSRLD
jgi:transglutaminase-like putative cysteine protease